MTPLPIDQALPEITRTVGEVGAVVIEAPPGAGKTTRVPSALLDGGLGAAGEIWVLEPRRLPARMAATRVAGERGERVGETVGYSVRFDEASGPRTRVRFVTEGLFVRKLLGDPSLRGVSAVVLDEMHERHVATDLALAWLRRLRATTRPELVVVAMSATLDAEPARAFLAAGGRGAGLVRAEGRRFDVAVEHLSPAEAAEDRPLERRVAAAVRNVLRDEPDGDILVFLPGAAEIRRAQATLAELPQAGGLAILPLHGDMPLDDQARAIGRTERRKVVLATNVAESSITVEGVVAVVDTGLARVAAHSPWTGLPALTVAKVSRASAEQRAGRAGRTRPGRALRLYTRHDFEQRPAYDVPEIARADLAELAMTLAALGVHDAADLDWLEPPPAAAWGAARALLTELGAVNAQGLTAIGRRMQPLPTHPRLARIVIAGQSGGCLDDAALAATLIAERDIRRTARASFSTGPGESERGADIGDLIEAFRDAERERFRPDTLRRLELDARAVEETRRARRQLLSSLAPSAEAEGDPVDPVDPAPARTPVEMALLAGFPDRVAHRREADGTTVVFAAGGAADVGRAQPGAWLVALDVVDARRAGRPGTARPQVRLSARIEPEWLLDLFPERVTEVDRRSFNPQTERIEQTSGLAYGGLLLDARTRAAPPDDETARLLADAALARGIERLPGGEAVPELLERIAFVRQNVPEAPLPDLGADALTELVRMACVGRVGFADLAGPGSDLASTVLASLSAEARRALEALAPSRVALGAGGVAAVHYAAAAPPWIESRLQDFFGTSAAPAIAGGRVPLTIHLLAPNGRAVQVTRDLAGFWRQHYPALRRELGRRYPKHAWPEDGATARPPPPKPPRRL
ncbi:MAG TPA: ATP-dependent helicase HrpB [Polyangia bacterium]|nr:ATP-dependent helicase HrpB [Polyangia bacterium]